MWLPTLTARLGFTSDARFFQAIHASAEAQLRLVDPTLMAVKE